MPMITPLTARYIEGIGKFVFFSAEIAVYLRNGTISVNSYYGSLTGRHRYSIDVTSDDLDWP